MIKELHKKRLVGFNVIGKMSEQMKIFLISLLLLFACLVPTIGQPSAVRRVSTDTLQILFRLDKVDIDMSLGNNQASWDSFKAKFLEHFGDHPSNDIIIDIYSGASPEGPGNHNRWLGENRGNAMRRLIRKELGDKVGRVVIHNESSRWEGFYKAIAASNEPWRQEVLDIIELSASPDEDRKDHRELKLRALYGGRLWPKLEKYLAPLRSGASAVVRLGSESGDGPGYGRGGGGRDTIYVVSNRDTVIIRETIVKNYYNTIVNDTLITVEGGAGVAGVRYDSIVGLGGGRGSQPPADLVRQKAWILRTNLPILGIGTFNAQAEWSLDHKDRWSINLEALWPWFTLSHNAYANELLAGTVELRYWLGNRRFHHTLDGLHLGLGAGGFYYDLEWKSKGYQGEGFMGYLNLGWQHRFGKRKQWAFDMGLGVGYLFSNYRKYHGSSIYPENRTEKYDDHLMWLRTSHTHWIGPNHLNLSLGYVFTTRKAPFRRAAADYRDELENSFQDATQRLERRIESERDSVYRSWLVLPESQRRAAQRAYDKQLKEERRAARRQAVIERREHKERLKKEAHR